jgi:hypothetical protein
MAGQLLRRPDPTMTSWELEAFTASHGSSFVQAHAIIGVTGHVEEVQLVQGAPGLSDAMIRAFREWVYKPYLVNGVPVRVQTTLSIHLNFGGGPRSASTDAIGVSLLPQAGPPPDDFCDGPWAKRSDYHVRVSSGTMAGQLVSRPDPVFPPLPRDAHVSGPSVLKVCISREGAVEKVVSISGPEILRQTVKDTISKWVYKPYLVDGKPVPVMTTIVLNIDFGGG